MANNKAMTTVKNVLVSTQGDTGRMLSEGLVHALQNRPEERHELQAALLKMVAQVLTTSQVSSKVAAEGTCQQNVDAADAEHKERQAATASASADLAAAKAAATAQKEKLESSLQQQTLEEEEHKRLEALDQEKANEAAVLEQGKAEVLKLLAAMAEQGNGEAIITYLKDNNAETPLVVALRTVLQKEPLERLGFDSVALTHLQTFLEQKVADWEADIKVHYAAQANIHAEMLGAWAVKEVAGDNVKEAAAELETAEAAARAAQQISKEAKQMEHQKERALSECLTELTLAGEQARQCGAALEVLEYLVTGQDMTPEAPAMDDAAPADVSMEVDEEMAASKMDAMMDVEMITA